MPMDKLTDAFELNELKFFNQLRDSLELCDKSSSQNLIDINSDVLFGWDAKESCLLALCLEINKSKKVSNEISHQMLTLSTFRRQPINKILCSPNGFYVAVGGWRGLSVVTLPRRTGPRGEFGLGQTKIECKSCGVDDVFLMANTHIEILQFRWHPASSNDSHLLVLLSNNTVRVYYEGKLRNVWKIGPSPDPVSPYGGAVPMLQHEENVTIDFDIVPPKPITKLTGNNITGETDKDKEKKQNANLQWPIVALRGSGHIYMLMAGLDSTNPQLQGPIFMMPESKTNYGSEESAIMVVPSFPPTLLITESNGNIHHGILLKNNPKSTEKGASELDEKHLHTTEYTIYIVETVELNVSLPKNPKKKLYTSPIQLKRDPINELRYYIYHNMGLHAVTINFIKDLENYMKYGEVGDVPALNTQSTSEYLLCTALNEANNSILGFATLHRPPGLIVFLANGRCVSLNTITIPHILNYFIFDETNLNPVTEDTPLKRQLKEPFQNIIYDVLKSDINQPILSLNQTAELNPKKTYDILVQAVQTIRENVLSKHEKARKMIIRKFNLMRMVHEEQAKTVDKLQKDRELLNEKAAILEERYNGLDQRVKESFDKSLQLSRKTNLYLVDKCSADKNFCRELNEMIKTVTTMRQNLASVKQKMETCDKNIDADSKNSETKKIQLLPKHELIIKKILFELSTSLQNQITEINTVKKEMNF